MATEMNVQLQQLRLEDHCLLQLSCHLEDYPLEALASLPLHLRRRLLLSLPAVDICQLEDTAVTEGINMEASVWRELVGNQQESILDFRDCSYKTSYFNIIFSNILDDPLCTMAKKLLFSLSDRLRRFVDQASPSVVMLSDVNRQVAYPVPLRHVAWISREMSQMPLIEKVLDRFKCIPESLRVTRGLETLDGVLDKVSSPSVLSLFLSKTKALSILYSDTSNYLYYRHLLRVLFAVILSDSCPVLQSLTLGHTENFVSRIMEDILVFFASPSAGTSDNPFGDFYLRLLPHVPYSGLSSLEVKISTDGSDLSQYFSEENVVVHEDLESIIKYQMHLTSVTLVGWDTSGSTIASLAQLYVTLGLLFNQPQFRSLKMSTLSMDWWQLDSLVSPFMAAPVDSCNGEKSLFLERIEVYSYDEVPDSLSTIVAVDLSAKSLTFSNTKFPDPDCIGPLFEWLSTFPCVGSFTLTSANTAIPLPGHATVMSLVGGWGALKDLVISNVSLLIHSFDMQAAFEALFGSPCLQKVTLVSCRIGPDGLLPSLSCGLLKQASVGRLLDLSFDDNSLGRSPDEHVVCFVDALLSLPQRAELSVSLRKNHWCAKHSSLMVESWKRSASRDKLKVLRMECSDNFSTWQINCLAREYH